MNIQKNVNLSRHSSWQVGGYADFFTQPQSLDDLKYLEIQAKEREQPVTLLGGGSNCLIADEGVRGLVISLKKLTGFCSFIEDGFLKIECLAGTPKMLVMREFLKHQLSPAVFLSGIPGQVGGGVVMNAGVSEDITPREFSEIVDWVDVVWEGQIIRREKSDLKWFYRYSKGWQPGIVARVGLKWPLRPVKNLMQKFKTVQQNRLSKQPLERPSCGSTFTNPKDFTSFSAGHIIEQCGLKGFQIGKARVSDKHANFIVNVGGAKAKDIDHVIEYVRNQVHQVMGFWLQKEVKYLGDWLH